MPSSRTISHEDFVSLLAEGFHTAFRKGTEHPSSAAIWRMIRDLPPEEYDGIVRFVAEGITIGDVDIIIKKKP